MPRPPKSRKLSIEGLARQPIELMKGMITLPEDEWAYDSELEIAETRSTHLGRLDDLPLELLHQILSMLNFKTIMRMAKTCTRGLTVVRSLPAYKDLIKHAPQALAAMGQTGLIVWPSAAALHSALQSSACVSCGGFGAFLYLPTCERCCNQCLLSDPNLWVIPPRTAEKAFGTTAAQLERLPVLRSIPSQYYMWRKDSGYYPEQHWLEHTIARKRRLRLVSVKTAKALALEGIAKDTSLEEDFLKHRDQGKFDRDLVLLLLGGPSSEGLLACVKASMTNYCMATRDKYCFMASVPFPHVTAAGERDDGYWCKGCEFALHDCHWLGEYMSRFDRLEEEHQEWFAQNIPEFVFSEGYLMVRSWICRSRDEFAEHLDECVGVRKFTVEGGEERLRRLIRRLHPRGLPRQD